MVHAVPLLQSMLHDTDLYTNLMENCSSWCDAGNIWGMRQYMSTWCLLHYSSCSGTTLQSLIRNYSNIDSWTPLLTTMHINAIWYSNWVLYFIALLAVAMLQSLMRNYMVDSKFCIGYCLWLLDFLCIEIFLWWYFLCGGGGEFQLIFSVCISWK